MGCGHSASKLISPNDFSDLDESFDNECSETETKEIDSHLTLNARQVFKLKQSWKAVRRKMDEAGIEMFIR